MISTARHSLSGEIEEDLHVDSSVETKFHVFPGTGHIILALIFTAPLRDAPSRFALSLIMHKRYLERYLVLHPVLQDHMLRLVAKLRTILLKVISFFFFSSSSSGSDFLFSLFVQFTK